MKKNNSIHPVSLAALCVTLSAAALPSVAQAQAWQFEPVVRVGFEYDDNAELAFRTDAEIDLTGYLLDVWADVTYSSQATDFFLRPRAVLRNYPDDTEFDSEDFQLRSRFSHKGELSTIGFRAQFDQESVRTAERSNVDLDIDDPEEIVDDSTGLVFRDGTRNRLRVTPYWNYQVSDITTIGAQLDYFNASYDDVFANTLTDYTDTRLDLNVRRRFSRANTGLLTLTARSYDPDDTSDNTTGYGVMAGFEYGLSPTTRLQAMFGLEDTEQEGFDFDPEPVGLLRLTRSLETIRLFAQYRRSASASGAGTVSAVDSFSLNFQRRLSERIGAGLGVRANHTDGATSIDSRNYVQLQSSFSWYLSRAVVIEVDYRYTVEDRSEAVGGRANSNQVNLWFVYQPKTTPRL